MPMTIVSSRVFISLVGLFFLSVFFNQINPDFGFGATSTIINLGNEQPVKEVIINIKTRKFRPDRLVLRTGERTRLVLINSDAELHAFLPVGLMTDTHINLSGSGSPKFSGGGLVRVLLPHQGQTEIVFVPSRPGNYPFFCDLPGHVMRGTIVVQDENDMLQ